ncbi:Ribosome-binding factor A [Candidatus Zixiibacteriota bacterium]|nr:Ribosome-binding factor A [candidate division Zixibacteria bacterium]
MKRFNRADRVKSQILRDIQTMLEQELAAKIKGMVTFTDVEISGDLRYATVYYSVLGQEEQKKQAAQYLGGIQKRVQSDLGSLLRLKHTPEIKFAFDPSIERGMRIEQLLNEIEQEKKQSGLDHS